MLKDEKDFLPLSEVKFVQVPFYDELSVGELFPLMKQNPDFMKYFMDRYSKGRLPDRSYFFNVMNTVDPEYTTALIKNAQEKRNTADGPGNEDAGVVISDKWIEKLRAYPFISSKSIFMPNFIRREKRPHSDAAEGRLKAHANREEAQEVHHRLNPRNVRRQIAAGKATSERGRADGRAEAAVRPERAEERDKTEAERPLKRINLN